MTLGDLGRARNRRAKRNIVRHKDEFINPYPWMSIPEAKVHLWLEAKGVPFSWRYFDAKGKAPRLTYMLKDFHPEFTLKEYKIVIMIVGGFWGSLPGIIDRMSMGQVLLEADGWKVAVLHEADIWERLEETLTKELPALQRAHIKGRPRKNPYGLPTYMERRRQFLRATALRRKQYWVHSDQPIGEKQNRARFKSRRRPIRASRRKFNRLGD